MSFDPDACPDGYCPHCRCDLDNGEHGVNCPRYSGPEPGDETADRVLEKLDKIGRTLDTIADLLREIRGRR